MKTNRNRLRIGTTVRVKLGNQYYHGVITRICNDNEYYNIELDNNMIVTAHLHQLSPILQFSSEELATLAEP